MGIQGLLPLLSSITNDVHISKYSGKVVAVDAYSWLYRGCYLCADEIALGKAEQEGRVPRYAEFCIRRVQMMQYFGVRPLLVFDGNRLPMKAGKEEERREARSVNHDRGMALLEMGDKEKAVEYFQKSITVTNRMAYNLMQVLRESKVMFIVAPYEADAQLAYLSKKELVAACVSEDSDLLAFGCRAVLYKMDKNGHGREVLREDFPKIKGSDLHKLTQDQFQTACVLSGCDYLDSVPGVGLKTAIKVVRKYKNEKRLVKGLRMEKKKVPEGYEQKFACACIAFRHQYVYDPVKRKMVHLNPLPEGEDASGLEFLGEPAGQMKAPLLCEGHVDPFKNVAFPHYVAGQYPQLMKYDFTPNVEPEKPPERGSAFDVTLRGQQPSQAAPAAPARAQSGGKSAPAACSSRFVPTTPPPPAPRPSAPTQPSPDGSMGSPIREEDIGYNDEPVGTCPQSVEEDHRHQLDDDAELADLFGCPAPDADDIAFREMAADLIRKEEPEVARPNVRKAYIPPSRNRARLANKTKTKPNNVPIWGLVKAANTTAAPVEAVPLVRGMEEEAISMTAPAAEEPASAKGPMGRFVTDMAALPSPDRGARTWSKPAKRPSEAVESKARKAVKAKHTNSKHTATKKVVAPSPQSVNTLSRYFG